MAFANGAGGFSTPNVYSARLARSSECGGKSGHVRLAPQGRPLTQREEVCSAGELCVDGCCQVPHTLGGSGDVEFDERALFEGSTTSMQRVTCLLPALELGEGTRHEHGARTHELALLTLAKTKHQLLELLKGLREASLRMCHELHIERCDGSFGVLQPREFGHRLPIVSLSLGSVAPRLGEFAEIVGGGRHAEATLAAQIDFARA